MAEKESYQPSFDASNLISHNFANSTHSQQAGASKSHGSLTSTSSNSLSKKNNQDGSNHGESGSVASSAGQANEMPVPYNEETIHKTILVGDSGVGKTSLLVQFDQGKFQSGSFSATVGIGFTNKIVTIDNKKVKLQIWDTAGQERFRSVTHAYYRDAQALLLLYDVTNQSSFDNIRAWLSEIRQYAEEDVVIMLLGNKVDKPNRVITKEQGEKLAKQYEVSFMETSAKTGQNVELSFMAVARALISKQMNATNNPTGSKFNLSEYIETNKEQKNWCCGGGT